MRYLRPSVLLQTVLSMAVAAMGVTFAVGAEVTISPAKVVPLAQIMMSRPRGALTTEELPRVENPPFALYTAIDMDWKLPVLVAGTVKFCPVTGSPLAIVTGLVTNRVPKVLLP